MMVKLRHFVYEMYLNCRS